MKKVMDTEALLAFYLNEAGAHRVEELLQKSLDGSVDCFLNIINLSEFYYIVARKSRKLADEKEKNLRSYGIRIISVEDDSIWKEAARMKASHSLALGDAFAAATAKILKADLVVGFDKEFREVGVRIEKIR